MRQQLKKPSKQMISIDPIWKDPQEEIQAKAREIIGVKKELKERPYPDRRKGHSVDPYSTQSNFLNKTSTQAIQIGATTPTPDSALGIAKINA